MYRVISLPRPPWRRVVARPASAYNSCELRDRVPLRSVDGGRDDGDGLLDLDLEAGRVTVGDGPPRPTYSLSIVLDPPGPAPAEVERARPAPALPEELDR